jgi:propanol-preferring alcohol dehydrogenase
MRAMVLRRLGPIGPGGDPLEAADLPDPIPGKCEILLDVSVCGVCHTELDIIEGRTPPARLPVIPGHQVVGRVAALGPGVRGCRKGDRMGVGWIFGACGGCRFCVRGEENLCPDFVATGRDANGGYAQKMLVTAAFAIPIPDQLSDDGRVAPLLCAGAVGYRALRLARLPEGGRLGLTGFGASGHLVLQMARGRDPATTVYVFARDEATRAFALDLGATWAGGTLDRAPEPLDAVIDTTPAWTPILGALRSLAPGGRLVINAIRKEDGDKQALLGLDYASDLWLEKEIKSVANVTRADLRDTLALAARIGLAPTVETLPLASANRALRDLRASGRRGALVLSVAS